MPAPPTSARTTVPSMGCGYLVCAVLAAAGIGLLWIASRRAQERRTTDAWVAGSIGGALCLASVALVAPMQRSVAAAAERRRREDQSPHEPWTWEAAWTGRGGIVQARRRHGRELIVFAWAALVISSPAVFALREQIAKRNYAAALALVFPVASLGILGVASLDAWRRRKYGVARFVPETTPIPLGGELAGMIVVDRPVAPRGEGRVTLACWCALAEGGSRRTPRETIAAQTERTIAAADWSTTTRESRLFVQLPLRGGEATTMTAASSAAPAYEWRLRVETPTAGADFVAEFVLPVFAVESTSRPAPPVERAEVWRAGGIAEAGPDVLTLPADAGRAVIGAPLVMALAFAAFAAGLWWSGVPRIFAVFFGAFALLPALTLPALWAGGGEQISFEGREVVIRRGGRTVRRIDLREVQAIDMMKNVGVGAQQFYRVVARLRPKRAGSFPPRVDLAAMVRGEEAARAVVAWLEERLTSRQA